ncbi:uncharacterized protein [Struthio camelus]|uniref:uncharacterized protein n=1 Tax=Struthio camelus TaxID=8801 RepID=UPI003604229A
MFNQASPSATLPHPSGAHLLEWDICERGEANFLPPSPCPLLLSALENKCKSAEKKAESVLKEKKRLEGELEALTKKTHDASGQLVLISQELLKKERSVCGLDGRTEAVGSGAANGPGASDRGAAPAPWKGEPWAEKQVPPRDRCAHVQVDEDEDGSRDLALRRGHRRQLRSGIKTEAFSTFIVPCRSSASSSYQSRLMPLEAPRSLLDAETGQWQDGELRSHFPSCTYITLANVIACKFRCSFEKRNLRRKGGVSRPSACQEVQKRDQNAPQRPRFLHSVLVDLCRRGLCYSSG